MARVNFLSPMDPFIKGTSAITLFKAKAFTYGVITKSTKESGKTIQCKDQES